MKRRYFRVLALRIPPHSWINRSYYIEEDVYAYSEGGAVNVFYRYHKGGYGDYSIESVKEISKEEFRGHHETAHVRRENETD